ncbi:MAG: glycosyltransferase family 4 protein [Isosphaeraceae bacterium]|nr:glycosyltransferase family 4 protein [Isosphaeraceae bacterium]
MDCDTITLPAAGVTRNRLGALWRYRRYYAGLAAKADDYDVALLEFHTDFWNGTRPGESTLPVFLRRLRRPAVMILHEWPELPEPEAYSGIWPVRVAKGAACAMIRAHDLRGGDYALWLQGRMFRRMAHIVVHDQELRDRLITAGMAAGRVTLRMHPVFPLPEACWSRTEVDERFGIKGRRVLLLFGFPDPRKGYDLAVRALASLPADTVIVLAGSARSEHDGRQVERLRQLAGECGVTDRFLITGYLEGPQLAAVLHRATLALAPFRSVTGSGSISHFLAAGLPVVASGLPSIAALATAGAGIRLFPAGDIQKLSEAVASLLGDPAARDDLRRRNEGFIECNTFEALASLIFGLATDARNDPSYCRLRPGPRPSRRESAGAPELAPLPTASPDKS